MRMLILLLGVMLAVLVATPRVHAQHAPFDRLSADVFEVMAPSERVRGMPGQMSVVQRTCRTLPASEIRRRIVDVAVQEWGFFGFPVRDETILANAFLPEDINTDAATFPLEAPPVQGFGWRVSAEESARVATSIAGYWAVTPQAASMVARQNGAWNGAGTGAVRWPDPWSAAFVSWVMCEAGLGDASRFQRAIAHHVYIDQAIRARDGRAPQAAFVAYDIGETAIAPGDLLCASRRPAYRTLAERRRQLGVGARSHCDLVVGVDEAEERILAIGGNVRRAVSLKVLPAIREPGRPLRPAIVNPARPMFAHLKLRAEPIEARALENSPTVRALGCGSGFEPPGPLAAVIPAMGQGASRC